METKISIPKNYLDFLRTSVPPFWEMKTALLRLQSVKGLAEFYAQVLSNGEASQSQLFQDIFVDFIFDGIENKAFLEFGATNGFELSNSWMLETKRGWRGVLAEADPQWHKSLLRNRPNARVILDCIYSHTGEKLKFISSASGVLSSLKAHAEDDANGPLALNARDRLKNFQEIDVITLSLNDVFENYFNGKPIEYMSVDTEGSEFEILSNFDFKKYHPSVVTVEHNFTDAEARLDKLFLDNGYFRIFTEFTNFDAWYVLGDLAKERRLV
jgi:FkbM family methyltransferase